MTDNFFKSLSKPLKMKFPSVPVDPPEASGWEEGKPSTGSDKERPAAGMESAGSYLRPHANEQLNARIAARMPEGVWEIKWQVELPKYIRPHYLLQHGDKVIVQGEGQWQLRDLEEGREIALDNQGDSDLAFHPAFSNFCYIDGDGYVVSHQRNGDVEHLCAVRFAEGVARLMIRRDGDTYFVYSLSYGAPPLGDGEFWAVEKIDLGDISKKDETNVLTDKKRLGLVLQKTDQLLCPAVHGSTSVLATNNRLYLMDDDLKITRAITGDFEPLALSLDEDGLIHVVVHKSNGDTLWVLTPEGELRRSVLLPPGLKEFRPPVIGFDHHIFLITSGRVLCLDGGGSVKWGDGTKNNPGGAIVTPDNLLLVSEGSSLLVFGADGERSVLATLEGETLCTPPVLTDRGELLVAGQRRLTCLTAAPRPSE